MARSFNGSSDYIDLGSSATLDPTGTQSIACWINASSYPTSGNLIAAFGNGYNGTASGPCLDIYNNAGTLNLRATIPSLSISWAFGGNMVVGTWYSVVATYDGSNQKLYVGGAVKATGTIGAGTATGKKTYIGAFDLNGVVSRFWPGSLADAAMWNVCLTAGEVAAIATGARPNTIRSASLLGYFALDTAVSTEPDYSGQKNNGTVTGTALASGPPMTLFTPRWTSILDVAAAAQIFGYTNSPMGSIRRIPNIIGY